jgi:isopentenyl diphosphate isomerase/L-lactate dehydrogenase-like FMN-dependent dehydrogenase
VNIGRAREGLPPVEVIVDGGITRGRDIFKALALGAKVRREAAAAASLLRRARLDVPAVTAVRLAHDHTAAGFAVLGAHRRP